MWRLKKKLAAGKYDPPTAMTSTEGKLLTSDEDIKKEAFKHDERVIDDKPMEESIKHLKEQREQLCNRWLEAARKKNTPLDVGGGESCAKIFEKENI